VRQETEGETTVAFLAHRAPQHGRVKGNRAIEIFHRNIGPAYSI